MKTKLFIILTAALAWVFMMGPSAWAGGVQADRWQGIAIAMGSPGLGSVSIKHYRYPEPAPSRVYRDCPLPTHHGNRYRKGHAGYWELRKVWVPPSYSRVWNPGHYNRYGKWVPGQWIKSVKNRGYWAMERIWVCR